MSIFLLFLHLSLLPFFLPPSVGCLALLAVVLAAVAAAADAKNPADDCRAMNSNVHTSAELTGGEGPSLPPLYSPVQVRVPARARQRRETTSEEEGWGVGRSMVQWYNGPIHETGRLMSPSLPASLPPSLPLSLPLLNPPFLQSVKTCRRRSR